MDYIKRCFSQERLVKRTLSELHYFELLLSNFRLCFFERGNSDHMFWSHTMNSNLSSVFEMYTSFESSSKSCTYSWEYCEA